MKLECLQDFLNILDQDKKFGVVSNGKVIFPPYAADGEEYYYLHFDTSPYTSMYFTLENHRNGRYRVIETSSTKPYNGGLIRKYLIIETNDRGDNKCKVRKGQ